MERAVRPSGRTTTILAVAVAVAVAAVAAAVAAAWLDWTGGDPGSESVPVKPVLLTAVWVVPGLLISLLRPRLALGWLALGEALLFAAAAFADAWIRHRADGVGGDVAWAAWVTDRFSAFLAVGIWVLLVLLPDGRPPSPRWRPVIGLIVGVQCVVLAAFTTVRGPAAGPDSSLPTGALEVANPVGVLPERWGPMLEGLDTVLLQVPLLLCLVAYVVRLRRAGPDERVRVVGTLLAASTFVLLVVVGHAWWPAAADTFDVVAAALLAAQLTVTVLGRRPRAVAAVVRQTFVHTVLVVLVGGTAILVAALLRRFGQDQPDSAVAVIAGGIALAVHPLRRHVTRGVDRLLLGDLHDPYQALQRLAEQTHAAPDADAVLAGMAASVAASLRVPWSQVEADGHVGSWGEPPGGAATAVELMSGVARIGTITVVPGPGRRLRSEELGLLSDLGRHGGVAVQAVLLAEAVRAGRQRLVVAREEERRRLRRDLHDGVGPTLAGLTMQLGAVRPLVRSDPDAVAERLGILQDAARGALDAVRHLSHGLRPPALDELGLGGALRRLADSLGLHVRFTDDDVPARLPAAVEVAVHLIAAEALHNVVRHAGTREVDVAIRVERDEVILRVHDAGAGGAGARPAGIGWATMRERADELGGTLEVESIPGRGTTVTARLPAREAEAAVLT